MAWGRKPDLAYAINSVPLDGWVCFPQAEWIYRVQYVLEKAGSVIWGRNAVTATAVPSPEPAPQLPPGHTVVGSLCILEGVSWTCDRKFCQLHSNKICPNLSGVRKASFASSFFEVIVWIHLLLWHQSEVVIDNILLFGENNTYTTKVKMSLWN